MKDLKRSLFLIAIMVVAVATAGCDDEEGGGGGGGDTTDGTSGTDSSSGTDATNRTDSSSGSDSSSGGDTDACVPTTCAAEGAECGEIDDGCGNTLTCPACGSGETCNDATNVCEADVTPTCGDGTLDTGETCDDGTANSDTTPDACRTDCTAPACGDSVTDTGETCDDGNTDAGDGCSDTCQTEGGPVCGDDTIDTGEDCDGTNVGTATCQTLLFASGDLGCDSDCTFDTSLCVANTCGDGFLGGSEECDDAGVATSTCDTDCTFAACGDNTLNAAAGETCDDGDTDAGDGCSDTCQTEGGPICGDGNIDTGEECDGINVGTALCSDGATPPTCAACVLDYSGCPVVGAGDTCDVPTNLDAQIPGTIQGDTTTLADDYSGYSTAGCLDTFAESGIGGDAAYSVTVAPGEVLSISLDSDADLGLYILSNCADIAGQGCLDSSDVAGGFGTEAATYTNAGLADEVVYIVVDGYAGDASAFDLTVSLTPAPVCGNDTIEGPEECDGFDLGGALCSDGTTEPVCAACVLDYSGCPTFGGETCAAPSDLTGGPFPVVLTGTFGDDPTTGFSCDASATNVAWFEFTPATTGNYTIDADNATTTAAYSRLAILDSLACGPYGAEVDCTTSFATSISNTVVLTAGTDYLIAFFTDGDTYTMVDPSITITAAGFCGDGNIDSGETCDGTNVGTALCSDGTTLPDCTLSCALDYSGCPVTGEVCNNRTDDDGNLDLDCADAGCATNAACDGTTPFFGGSAPGLDIPDATSVPASDTINLATSCTIQSITVDVDITHSYIGDLTLTLTSPEGTTVTLHDEGGGGADNIIGNYPGTLTVSGPGALADFVGDNTAGVWTLSASDSASGDEGTINTWGLNITCGTVTPTEICDDATDNDGDLLNNCADPDCATFPACLSSGDGLTCPSSLDLTGATFPVVLTGTFDNDPAAGFSCDTTPTNVVWYEFTPPTTGNYTISASNATTTAAYSRLAVANGLSCSPYGTQVACVTNTAKTASTTVSLTAGMPYLIAFYTDGATYTMVDPSITITAAGFCGDGNIGSGEQCDGTNVGTNLCSDGATPPSCTLSCTLDYSTCPVPDGELCTAPEDLTGATFPVTLTGTFGNDPVAGFTCDSTPTNVVWYEYTAPTTGTYTIDAFNATTTFAYSRLVVLDGLACSPYGSEVACVPASDVSVSTSVNLTAGSTYLIAFFTDGNTYTMVDPEIAITPPPGLTISSCRLQHPANVTGNAGADAGDPDVYGRVTVPGLTDLTPGNDVDPQLVAQFGFGPDGSVASPAWTWADAAPNPGWGGAEVGADEYQFDWKLPATPGQYDYAYRFSADGGSTWTYCDTNEGSTNGYDPAMAGQATVNPSAPITEAVVSWHYNASAPTSTGGNAANAGKLTITNAGNPVGTVTYPAGNGPAPNQGISANNWSTGEYWQVEFTSTGYTNLILTSSCQRSSATGPRDYQLQYSINGTNWTNVPGAATVLPNAAYLCMNNVALPVELNNQSQAFLRWVVVGSTATNGSPIDTTNGTNRLDDVIITGTR